MISLGKTILITGILTCAVANATNNKSTPINVDVIQKNKLMFYVPKVASDGAKSIMIETKKIAYSHDNFVLPKVSSKKVTYKGCQSKKKNELYELSAIFNDKLQMFLSYIDDSKSFNVAEKKDSSNDLNINSNVRIY
ncbi:hypothetical protein Q4493_02535 [Colwellia sp. 1_MG-2023]|uniref:hypothetical protein n=1 Tax=Colwellia sp. 1_MG-2023 TaxID=3062649 RepID=UPI0026E36ABD|nr:hypothetical protein [Colwellia sp. 1_MG-2023]MDO6444645.1 hypothetical protein [Colwellia sp. 1_MG-2023]